jgi:hypothetical protein
MAMSLALPSSIVHEVDGPRKRRPEANTIYPWEVKALVRFLVQQDALGRPVRIKYIPSIAFSLARRQRPLADRPSKPPNKNWPQFFYKRHPELRASKNGALDWNRYDIYDKVVHWFEVIGKVL